MNTISEVRRKLQAVPNLKDIERHSGVSYRHLLRIKNGRADSISLRTLNKIERALAKAA